MSGSYSSFVDPYGFSSMRPVTSIVRIGGREYRILRAVQRSDGGIDVDLEDDVRYRDELRRGGESEELVSARAQIQAFSNAIETIKSMPAPYATVTRVRDKNVVLVYAGKTVEVKRPDGKDLAPGKTVKIHPETFAIIDTVPDDDPGGEVCRVTRIVRPGLAEIDRAGACRAVSFSGAVEEDDRVVLDQTGVVVVSNLGKAKNESAFTEATHVTWDDIGGLADAKRAMREAIESPVRHKAILERLGKRGVKGVLLYGRPGNGKTMLGKAAATALADVYGSSAGGAFFYVKGPALLNMYVGNTEAGVRKLFEDARRHKKKHGFPAIIFLDEADAILGKRGGFGFGLQTTVVPALLAEMDGMEDSGAIVILATNRPDTLDPAIVRDGRIDRRVKVTAPDEDSARAIFLKHLVGKPLGQDAEDLAAVGAAELFAKKRILYRVKRESKGDLTDKIFLGHTVSGAMVAGVVDRATSIVMHRCIGGSEDDRIDTLDMIAAVDQTHEEALDVSHDEEILEFCSRFMLDVKDIVKERGPSGHAGHGAAVSAEAS